MKGGEERPVKGEMKWGKGEKKEKRDTKERMKREEGRKDGGKWDGGREREVAEDKVEER